MVGCDSSKVEPCVCVQPCEWASVTVRRPLRFRQRRHHSPQNCLSSSKNRHFSDPSSSDITLAPGRDRSSSSVVARSFHHLLVLLLVAKVNCAHCFSLSPSFFSFSPTFIIIIIAGLAP